MQIEDFRTDSEKIAEQIENAIIRGEFKAGEKLPQRFLAEHFKTTTTVVREALRSVQNDELVQIIPRFGAIVYNMTTERLYGRYMVREALEVQAARIACRKITEKNSRELLAMAKECDEKLPKSNVKQEDKIRMHLALHLYIAEITEIPELISPLKNNYLSLMIKSNAERIEWNNEYENWHTLLVNSILSGNPDTAEEMMRKHVQRGYEMEAASMMRNEEEAINS